MRWLTLQFTLQDLVYDWRRSVLNLALLTIMSSSYLLVAILGQAFQSVATHFAASSSNLVIVSDPILDLADSYLPLDVLEGAAQALRQEFGPRTVTAVVPVQYLHLNLENQNLQVLGAAPDTFETVFQLRLISGNWLTMPGQVLVSRGAALSADWQIGQQIMIFGRPFQLIGIVETPSRSTASLWMSLQDGMRVFGEKYGIQFGVLQVDLQADLDAVQTWLDTIPLFQDRYAVYQQDQLNDLMNQAMLGLLPLANVFHGLALLLLVFGGFNVASLTLLERQAEASLLNLIGFSSRSIQAFVLCRTAVLTAIAYPCGWAAAWLLQKTQPGGLVVYGANLDLVLYSQVAWQGVWLALLSTLVGAWVAARDRLGKVP